MMDPTLLDLWDGAPGAPAVEDAEGEWSRGELAAAAGGVARALRVAGVRPGERVAVVSAGGRPLIAGLLGARAAGALACPVSPREATLLPRLDARAVLVDGVLPGGHPRAVDLLAALADPAPLEVDGGPEEAWGIATSGTTGPPRVVLIGEDGVAFVTDAVDRLAGYQPGERVLCPLPLHHTYGLSQLWLCLRAGAILRLPRAPVLPGDLAREAEHADVLATVSTTARQLLSTGARPRLRLVTLAGQETLPEDRARFAQALPETAFVVYYGQTEATTRVLWLPPEDFTRHPDAAGVPLPGVDATLVDGELVVRGPNVALGYLDDPVATEERFRGGALHTGDLFEACPGGLRFLGRRDGTFKRAGEKVVPERVEAALRAHPGVAAALVLPERGDDGDLVPVAWIVGTDTPVSERDLVLHLRRLLPSAMVPVRHRFVPSLPMTPSGKLARKAPE